MYVLYELSISTVFFLAFASAVTTLTSTFFKSLLRETEAGSPYIPKRLSINQSGWRVGLL